MPTNQNHPSNYDTTGITRDKLGRKDMDRVPSNFKYGTNSAREKSREPLIANLGTWATFLIAGWCVLIGSYLLVNFLCDWGFGGVR